MLLKRRFALALALAGALAVGCLVLIQPRAGATPGLSYRQLSTIQKRIISQTLASAMGASSSTSSPNAGPGGDGNGGGPDGASETPPRSYEAASGPSVAAGSYTPASDGRCSLSLGSNVKVNQNCLNISDGSLQGRAQANNETSIAQNPLNTADIVASDNNYVRGDGTCGVHFSTNNGRTWADSTTPNGFTYGPAGFPRQYWQAGGDTSVAWDSRGNAYLSCQLFDRGQPTSPNPDTSSTFVVFRSTHNNGASWNFPGRYSTPPAFNSDNSVLVDKALMAIDANPSSQFRDRIYVTWTQFAADGTAYIYEVHSNDYGETFSTPVLVSAGNPACTNTYGLATPQGTCNVNQNSDPFVGPDGSLYVAYDNFNNQPTSGSGNQLQVLLAKSTDGGSTFSAPAKVSDYHELPDCDSYQGSGADPARACVPEKGSSTTSVFRATNYPAGAVDPTNPRRVAITFGSYINQDSNESNGCAPAGLASDGGSQYTGVKTPGACANKILVSVSTDGGASFGSTDPRTATVVPQAKAQRHTDQYWQWAAFTPRGRLAVDYYDRQYGHDETTGSSDFSLSGSSDLASFGDVRVTTSSMPAPTQFEGPNGGLFYGDYIWLSVAGNQAHPIWSDTRSRDLFLCPGTGTPAKPPALCGATEPNGVRANDEEIVTDTVPVPSGK